MRKSSRAADEERMAANVDRCIPFIETHHHLWELGRFPYRWLRDPGTVGHNARLGDYKMLRVDWGIDRLLKEFYGSNVIKSVHVEGDSGATDPVAETEWLQAIADTVGFPQAIVVFCDLQREDAEEQLARHARFKNTRGVRIREHPDNPDAPVFRRAYAALAKRRCSTGTPSTSTGSRRMVLEIRGISKRFGPIQALDDVSLKLQAGEIHALLGENGAGKSTLIKIMTGVEQPDAGELHVDGRLVRVGSAIEAQALGIAAVYQEPMIFPDLSVAENIFISHRDRGRIVDRAKMRRYAAVVLERLGARLDVGAPARGLTVAAQQTLEIAKALSLRVRVLIMDEPTASLSAHETRRLFGIVKALRREGVAILFVSHRMEDVFQIADRITVLRDGRWISTRPVGEVTPASAIRDMVGRTMGDLFRRTPTQLGDVVLEFRGLAREGAFAGVSFTVRAGEDLGRSGLVGARRTDVGLV